MLQFLQLLKLKIRIGLLLMSFFVFCTAKSPLPLFAKEGGGSLQNTKTDVLSLPVINIKYAN